MSLRLIILLISCLGIIGCFDSKYSDRNIEAKALAIVNRLNNDSVNIFKEWNYSQRGPGGYWSKDSANTTLYITVYSVEKDTITLIILQPTGFFKDFSWNYLLDTSKYNRVILSKFKDSVRIKASLSYYEEVLDTVKGDSLFIRKDPFEHFSKLNDLKNTLGVFGISYRGDIGDFIQFYLSSKYVLTYLPENAYFNPKSKDIWLKEFEKGKMIKRNWNLRKLEHPLDNG